MSRRRALARHASAPGGAAAPLGAVAPARNLARAPRLSSFRSAVWKYWKKEGRHELPWRKTRNAYRILVSETMLQQTQVPRVIGKYRAFIKRFPTARALSRAALHDVLKEWNGLGYNRRAKFLHDAAKIIVERHSGKVPRGYAELRALPGIGDYTARAVRVFAFNEPDVLLETNIRTAFIHHFFNVRFRTSNIRVLDAEILAFARVAAEGQDPREWHSALMDYGAHLKRSGVRTNARSRHYAKQSKFEGSVRQARGAILRSLARGTPMSSLRNRTYKEALAGLKRDGLIRKTRRTWRIA